MSRVEGVQRSMVSIRSNKSKVSANFKGSRASGLFLRGSWLQRYNTSKHSKVSMTLERQVSKVEGAPGFHSFQGS